MEETKKCPYCGEEIKSVAIKCKFCGEFLDKNNNLKNIQSQDFSENRLARVELNGKYGYINTKVSL